MSYSVSKTPETVVAHILKQSMQFMKEINKICMWVYCMCEKIISNCYLIIKKLSVTVTDYNYIYFVIKLRNLVRPTCN